MFVLLSVLGMTPPCWHTRAMVAVKKIEEIRWADGGFCISVEQSVALKADLSIPWSKLRIMRR